MTSTNSLRVMVVDDDPDVGDALTDLLELLGHTAALARGGAEAVALAKRFAPEVVLCDLTLPVTDGYAVARALRLDPLTADSELVAVSGHATPDVADQVRAAGFDRHLPKPFGLDELHRLLGAVAIAS
jgi:CheY-like chemotaxis protein